MKEPVNDLPVDEWEHGEVVHYYVRPEQIDQAVMTV
jgi:hypothetical protein